MSCNEPEISDLLLLLLEENLPPDQHQKLTKHLADCAWCRKEFEELSDVTNTVKTAAGKLRQVLEHPSPDELMNFVYSPEEISGDGKFRIQKHLDLCSSCNEETVLLRESPEFSKEPVEEIEAVMSEVLMKKFRETYQAQKVPEKDHLQPITDDASSTNTFWEQLGCIFKPRARFAYILTALLMVFTFLLGVHFSPGISKLRQTPSPPGQNFLSSGEFVQYPTTGLSDREIGKMVGFLQKQGISAYKYKNEIWIKDSQVKNAFGLIVLYQKSTESSDNILVAGNNPQATPYHYPAPESTIVPGLPFSTSTPVMVVTNGSPSPASTRIPVNMTPSSSSKLAVSLPGEGELFHSSFNSRNGISRTPWDIDRPSDAVILHHEALTSAPNLLALDLEERDISTEKIRNQFRDKVFSVLDEYPELRNSLVYVTASLDFQKNQYDVFPIRGIKITVVTAKPVSNREKRIITGRIRESVGWKDHWDGDIEFSTP
jgi:hypothetical protein